LRQEFAAYQRVLLRDSTCFQVPEDMKSQYPGSGGKDTGAAVRIQFEFDALSGTITELSLNAFNHQDALSAMESIDIVQEGDLIIRDLGYMHKKVLHTIAEEKKAIYAARLDPRIAVYELINGQYERIDFAHLRAQMKKGGVQQMEKCVYLGAGQQHCTRLVISTLPPAVEEWRLRTINKKRKRNGSAEPSKELKARSCLTLMITNECCEKLPADKLYLLYMVRWQIELVFKTWKSVCGLASLKMVQGNRVNCYIHGKMVLILLSWSMIWPLRAFYYCKCGKIVSLHKATKTILGGVRALAAILIHRHAQLRAYLRNLYNSNYAE
jgi:hypothetical protein